MFPLTVQLPANLYDELQALATDEDTDLIDMIRRLVTVASQRRGWLRDLNTLREQIRQDGGLQVGNTQEEVVERLRETRRQIYESDYAALYR